MNMTIVTFSAVELPRTWMGFRYKMEAICLEGHAGHPAQGRGDHCPQRGICRGLAVGFWKAYNELRANWGKEKEWHPAMDAERRKKLYSGWKKAVTRTFDWVE